MICIKIDIKEKKKKTLKNLASFYLFIATTMEMGGLTPKVSSST
jgi:hypothetical protein